MAQASAAKMGVNSLTRSFALEWSDYGIRAIGVSPGAIADTAGTAKLGGMGGSNPRRGGMPPPEDDSVPRVMRMGTVDDIGLCCVFLCSEAGGWISGDSTPGRTPLHACAQLDLSGAAAAHSYPG